MRIVVIPRKYNNHGNKSESILYLNLEQILYVKITKDIRDKQPILVAEVLTQHPDKLAQLRLHDTDAIELINCLGYDGRLVAECLSNPIDLDTIPF